MGDEVEKPGGGLLGRWENIKQTRSNKRMVECDAATPEYQRKDYLKPQHLPMDRVDEEANYLPTSNLQDTRFHRGFQRRHKSNIQPDAARLEYEVSRQLHRDQLAEQQVELAKAYKDRMTFNILTGEGAGRECEFKQVGKRILNAHGAMASVFGEHQREDKARIRNSKHRFFEYPAMEAKDSRATNLFQEGLFETKREACTIGVGGSNPRNKTQSCGVADNFAHLRATPPEPVWEEPVYGNRSQIILG